MKTVNPYFLHTLLGPLVGLADDDQAIQQFGSLNSNDMGQMKYVIRELLVPHFLQLTDEAKDRTKVALAYYLVRHSADFGRVFNSCLPPFDPPSNPRDFFVWVWEELFPSESFETLDRGNYQELPDINEPNLLAAQKVSRRESPGGRKSD